MAYELRTISEGFCFLEAPRWHAGRLWLTDIYDRTIYSIAEDGSDRRVEARTPGLPCGIDFDQQGRLVIVLMHEHEVLVREPDGALRTLARVSDAAGPLNDLTAGPDGHLYIGAVGFDPSRGESIRPGSLLRLGPSGDVVTVAEQLSYPNGIAITDAGTLLVAESFGNRVSSFLIHEDGSLGDRETFVRFGPSASSFAVAEALAELEVTPDGCCLDDEGGLWVADAIHNRVLRVTKSAGITQTLDVNSGVFACMLGGSNGRTLYLCVAPDSDPAARSSRRESRLLAVSVDRGRAGRP